jgi:aldose 1-epimerase
MGFRTSVQRLAGGRDVVKLLDDSTGASASVLPSYGFNLCDLQLPVGGKPTPIVVSEPGFAEAPSHPARSGVPILFPYPNRVRAGKFTFGGKEYQLPINNGPNAIHGFAMDAEWKLASHGTDSEGAFVEGQLHLNAHPEGKPSRWPTDGVIEVRYSLAGRKLTMKTTVSNPTDQDFPYGFGIHPYFRIPFSPDGDTAQTSVIFPAAKYWALQDFLPTGEIKDVDERLDFRKGQPRKGLKLDDVLTGIVFEGDRATCRLVDLAAKAEFRIGFDKSFRELVVFTPSSHADVIAIEPYTQTTDAINLQAQGKDAGLRVLKHGESDTLVITMETADRI